MEDKLNNDTITIRRLPHLYKQNIITSLIIFLASLPFLLYRIWFFALMAIICSAILFIAAVYNAFDLRAQMILSKEELNLLGVGRLSWNQIKSIHCESRPYGVELMLFTLHNSGAEPIIIQIQHLDVTPSELHRLINERIKAPTGKSDAV